VTKKETKKSGKKKDAQLILRLDKEQRDAFVDLCKEMDTSAAREIRRFIRGFLKEHGED
jgi:flagellar motor switch protein FliG